MTKRIVVALGGNAILTNDPSAQAQQKKLAKIADDLVKFVENGDQLILTHGNSPQVGNLLLQQYTSDSKKNPAMPLNTCVAMTQGSLGYWIQKAMDETLAKHHITNRAISLVTQVEVNADDHAFKHPTKTIGPFMNKYEAEKCEDDHPEYTIAEDAGRGYRRAVPSPKPLNIIESKAVEKLANSGFIPITVGGGGIPVTAITKSGDIIKGLNAVIDKDCASAELAKEIHADELIILTAVKNVYINYRQPNQTPLKHVTVKQLDEYMKDGQFPAGSMLPKVKSVINYVKSTGHTAAITALDNIDGFLSGTSGTFITK